MEFWTTTVGMPSQVARAAAQAEAHGWDGIGIPYAPTMAADPYVCLGLAATATSRLQLSTFVATPASHTPASAAGSIKTVQAVSNGRAVLAMGRGDSALAYLGMAPAPLAFFEAYLSRLRHYLQDEAQPFDLDLDGGGHFNPVDSIGLAQQPDEAKFAPHLQDIPTVPLDMVATGPKVLALAGLYADRVSFAVGADPERVSWAKREVEAARKTAGIDRAINYGAWVPLVVTDDLVAGRRMLSGVTTSMARFSTMHGKLVVPAPEQDRKVYDRVYNAYEMSGHFREGSKQSKEVPDEFMDRFAVIGPVETCVKRLLALKALGIERFVISGPSAEKTPELAKRAVSLFTQEVMPALR